MLGSRACTGDGIGGWIPPGSCEVGGWRLHKADTGKEYLIRTELKVTRFRMRLAVGANQIKVLALPGLTRHAQAISRYLSLFSRPRLKASELSELLNLSPCIRRYSAARTQVSRASRPQFSSKLPLAVADAEHMLVLCPRYPLLMVHDACDLACFACPALIHSLERKRCETEHDILQIVTQLSAAAGID